MYLNVCITKMKWILSITADISHSICYQAQFNMHIMIYTANKTRLLGSVFQPPYVEPFPDWNISWNPACFWIGNIDKVDKKKGM